VTVKCEFTELVKIIVANTRRMCACMSSVTLVHPVKAIGLNEMLLGRNSCVVPCDVVLDRCPGLPTGREDLGLELPVPSMPPIAKLLWPLYDYRMWID